jgi:hypothetical protein
MSCPIEEGNGSSGSLATVGLCVMKMQMPWLGMDLHFLVPNQQFLSHNVIVSSKLSSSLERSMTETKLFIERPLEKLSRGLLALERKHCRLIQGLLSGHCTLRYLHVMGILGIAVYKKCGQ